MKFILQMADVQFPSRVDEYCKYFNISFLDLRLRCIFCNHYLGVRELAEFYEKQLSLVWRKFECFACCEQCVCLSAKFERENFFQCAIKPDTIVDLAKQSLQDVTVRCIMCMTLLDVPEKFDHLCRNRSFMLVRSHFKGYCRRCMQRLII